MYDDFRNRMSRRGAYVGETMRNQTSAVVDAVWMNSVTTLPVCVHAIDSGLPPTYYYPDEFEETIYAHFEPNKKYSVGGNAVDYYLVFQPHVYAGHNEIHIGSYVSIPNINGDLEYWLIVYIEEDNGLIRCRIIKCNWILRWVAGNKTYKCLGVLRGETADAEGIETAGYISSVDSKAAIWLPTNTFTKTIGMNTRFLISGEGRIPPQAWKTSKIVDVLPVGLTKITLTQNEFDPAHDNSDLMIADYFDGAIVPEPSDEPSTLEPAVAITYNGTKPTVKVGGNYKVFTATFKADDVAAQAWSVSDGANTFSESVGDYIIEHIDGKLRLKVKQNYELVGTVLTIKVLGVDGSTAEIKVEVVA